MFFAWSNGKDFNVPNLHLIYSSAWLIKQWSHMQIFLGCAFSSFFYELGVLCTEYLSVVIFVRSGFNYRTGLCVSLPGLSRVIPSRRLFNLSIIFQIVFPNNFLHFLSIICFLMAFSDCFKIFLLKFPWSDSSFIIRTEQPGQYN